MEGGSNIYNPVYWIIGLHIPLAGAEMADIRCSPQVGSQDLLEDLGRVFTNWDCWLGYAFMRLMCLSFVNTFRR